MKMKNTLKNLTALALTSLALAPFAVADLEKYLPEGKTLALAKIENAASIETRAATNPFARELNEKFLQPIWAEIEKGATADELKELSAGLQICSGFSEAFPGEIVGALLNVKSGKQFQLEPVIIADCAENVGDLEVLAELLQNTTKAPIKNTKIKLGKTSVPAKKTKDFVFAVKDGKFIFSTKARGVRQILTAMASEKISGLPASAAFKKARERIGTADFWVYVNGKAVAREIYNAAENYDKELAEEMQNDPGKAMFSVMATPIAKAFAPESVDSIWCAATLTETGAVSESALTWNANKGVVSLLTSSLKNGFEKPAFFPQSPELVSVNASSFSVGAFVNQLMALGREASPLFGIVDMQLMNLKASENVDVPATLAALGNGSFSYSLSAQEPREMVFVQTVTNKTPIIGVLEKIAEKLGPSIVLEKTPVTAGTPEIYTFSGNLTEDCQANFSAVFLGDKLCIGEQKMIAQIIAQYAKGEGAPSVWDDAKIKAGEAMLPAGGVGISYSHLGKTIASTLKTAKETALENASDGNAQEVQEKLEAFFAAVKIKSGDLDYSSLTKTYLGENEISAKTVIYKN